MAYQPLCVQRIHLRLFGLTLGWWYIGSRQIHTRIWTYSLITGYIHRQVSDSFLPETEVCCRMYTFFLSGSGFFIFSFQLRSFFFCTYVLGRKYIAIFRKYRWPDVNYPLLSDLDSFSTFGPEVCTRVLTGAGSAFVSSFRSLIPPLLADFSLCRGGDFQVYNHGTLLLNVMQGVLLEPVKILHSLLGCPF